MRDLTSYMVRTAVAQGSIASLGLYVVGRPLLLAFTNPTTDLAVRSHLVQLWPLLVQQMPLVSLVLVTEGLVVGWGGFRILAIGTALSTVLTVVAMSRVGAAATATSTSTSALYQLWQRGIVLSLFGGRLLTALLGIVVSIRTREEPLQPITQSQQEKNTE